MKRTIIGILAIPLTPIYMLYFIIVLGYVSSFDLIEDLFTKKEAK